MTHVRLTRSARRELAEVSPAVRKTLLRAVKQIENDPACGTALLDEGLGSRRLDPTGGYSVTFEPVGDDEVLITSFSQPHVLTAEECMNEVLGHRDTLDVEDPMWETYERVAKLAERISA